MHAEHSQHNKDERTNFFRKIYLSLYSKGLRKGYCVRGDLETEQNCNILTPTLLATAALISRSAGLLNRGLGPSFCWDLVLTARTATTDFKLWSPKLTDFLSHPGYIIVWYPPASCGITIRTQFNPSTVKVIPLISSTGCTCYLHRCISHLTAWPGRRSICYNGNIFVKRHNKQIKVNVRR